MATNDLLQELKNHSNRVEVVYRQLTNVMLTDNITESVALSKHAHFLTVQFLDFLELYSSVTTHKSGYHKSQSERLIVSIRETCRDINKLRSKISMTSRASFGVLRNTAIPEKVRTSSTGEK